MWNRIHALIVKELLALLKDKRARVVLVAPPILQIFIFGYAATFDLNHVPYAVLNEDSGSAPNGAKLRPFSMLITSIVAEKVDAISP